MQQTGYLLLADISGYTEFITQTEIDHGAEILEGLIQVVLDETKAPFKLQEIEGDAIFSYAPGNGFERGVVLVEMVEAMYGAFRSARDDARRNTTCTCRACACMTDLDMKFIIHYGTFTPRAVGGRSGIAGPDVVLVHRLLKNRIVDTLACPAYAFFTEAAVEALGIEALTAGMQPHEETYEHLGTVGGFVLDVGACWDEAVASRSIRVDPETAFLALTARLPVPRSVAWEYYTNPAHRRDWLFADRLDVEGTRNGRYGAGTVEHCMHGKADHIQKTLDWKPLRYATQASVLPFNGFMPYTASFKEEEGETHVSVAFGQPEHDSAFVQGLLRLMVRSRAEALRRELGASVEKYFTMVREEGALVGAAAEV